MILNLRVISTFALCGLVSGSCIRAAEIPRLKLVAALPQPCRDGCYLQMTSRNGGWLRDRSQIWRTSNGGVTWQARPTPAEVPLASHIDLKFGNEGFGWWLVSGSGPIYFTRNHSQDWSLVPFPKFDGQIGSVALIPGNTIAAVGGSIYESTTEANAPNFALKQYGPGSWGIMRPVVFISSDQGQSWKVGRLPDCSYIVKDVRFWNSFQGYALGDGCFTYTADGGRTWEKGNVPPGRYPDEEAVPVSVMFVDERNGWMNFSDGSIFRTLNRGLDWQLVSQTADLETRQGSVDIKFVSTARGFAVSRQGRLYETGDGGKTWKSIPIPFLARSIAVLGEHSVWVLSNTDLYTLAP